MPGRNGVLNFAVPDVAKNTKAGLEQEWAGSNLKTTTASVKFKYAPTESWYFEGGYQWQKAIRDMYGTSKTFTNQNDDFSVAAGGGNGAASRFDVQSWFAKAATTSACRQTDIYGRYTAQKPPAEEQIWAARIYIIQKPFQIRT